MSHHKHALVIGHTGVVGGNLASHLINLGDWKVTGVARNSLATTTGVTPITVDLLDRNATLQALSGLRPTHLYFTTWTRRDTEAENIKANGAMLANVLDAVAPARSLRHAALVTGTKHYLGPFESYGASKPDTPFTEDRPRLPGENFYYTQEDILFAQAATHGFGWSVHRPHTIVGYALGNAMNMGVTLAIYASICKETGQAFVFPGSRQQYEAVTDMTDARLLARHLTWASTCEAGRDEAFNVVNGDLFRWRQMWATLAEEFGLVNGGFPSQPMPLAQQMATSGPVWDDMVKKYGLQPHALDRLASWWHTDGDLGRDVECFNSMTKSRAAGFGEHHDTAQSFRELFVLLRGNRIIP
ncbi:SDR family oxidoreductase [Variovorax sp. PAMC28562]|uniref:SDR family oxidoreductase n=1 Tax=Variovorax sp. PAMC28562 TaxID=2762323 RepID=UPI00164D1592|nr:SDR family oxidoreductase [Variovorax sp. PAMC28562]QNK75125.1 SDR family oxidoreductase [Variovorax sp. PAMC28562]